MPNQDAVDVELIKCGDCDQDFDKADNIVIDGMNVCESCRDDYYFYCEGCNNYESQDDCASLPDGTPVCEECFDEKAFNCHNCNEAILNDDKYVGPDDNDYCQECFYDSFSYCESCAEATDDIDEDGNCPDCTEDSIGGGLINDYGYQPKLKFQTATTERGDINKFLGVELEVEASVGTASQLATKFKAFLVANKLDEYLYFKDDGSLQNGFEIVSHPFTLKAFHTKMHWRKILNWLKANGAISHKSGRCGMHVHISSKAVGMDERRKIKLFMAQHQERIRKFSAREADKMGYCKMEPYSLARYQADKIGMHVSQDSRHVAFNCYTNKSTCEFRLFRGTLNYKRFLASLQFSDALCDFVKDMSPTKLASEGSFNEWMRWLKRSNRHQHLWKYLNSQQDSAEVNS